MLVIIGLIVGGVLVGQDLIKSAAIRSVISQLAEYSAATNTFKSKYNQLPGDISNPATWGFSYYAVPPAYTSNNDGSISDYYNYKPVNHYCYEPYFFMVHLSQAGFIREKVSNANFGCGSSFSVGQTIPALRSGYGGLMVTTYSDGRLYFLLGLTDSAPYGTFVFHAVGALVTNPVLTPEQAYGIDIKLDDGVPKGGSVFAIRPVAGNYWLQWNKDTTAAQCVVDASAAAYNLSNSARACWLMVRVN